MTKYSKLFKDHSWYSNLSSQFLWYSWPDSASTSWLARSAFFSLIRWNRSLTILWSSWWSKLWWWWWLWWAGRCTLLFNCHNTKCSLRPHEVNLSLSQNQYWEVLRNVKYLQTYGTVVVYVKHPEYLLEVLLRTPVGHDIENNHEFPEVNMTILHANQIMSPSTYQVCFLQKYLQRNFLSYHMTFTSFVSYIRNMWRSSFSVSVPG